MKKFKRRLGDPSSWTLLIFKHLSWTCVGIQHLEFLIVEWKIFRENKWDDKSKLRRFINTETSVTRKRDMIGLDLTWDHCFHYEPYHVVFHKSLLVLLLLNSIWCLFNTSLTGAGDFLSGDIRRWLRMNFSLLFVLLSLFSVVPCPTRAQGEYEKFSWKLLFYFIDTSLIFKGQCSSVWLLKNYW